MTRRPDPHSKQVPQAQGSSGMCKIPVFKLKKIKTKRSSHRWGWVCAGSHRPAAPPPRVPERLQARDVPTRPRRVPNNPFLIPALQSHIPAAAPPSPRGAGYPRHCPHPSRGFLGWETGGAGEAGGAWAPPPPPRERRGFAAVPGARGSALVFSDSAVFTPNTSDRRGPITAALTARLTSALAAGM